MPYTAILAPMTSLMVPSAPRGMHMPRTTVVAPTDEPRILATRMLSHARLRDARGEEVLVAPLLGRDDRTDGRRQLRCVVQGVGGGVEADEGVDELKRLGLRRLVPADDLGHVQARLEQLLGHAQQLAGQHYHKVGPVANLDLLHVGGHDEELGGRVLNLQLAHDGGGVVGHEQLLQVVDHLGTPTSGRHTRVGS
eukprot:scaffold6040_cov132-Isochrysis_galbana.AAC.2